VPPQPPEIEIEILLPDQVRLKWPRFPEIDRPMFNRYNVFVKDLFSLNEELVPNVETFDHVTLSVIPNTTYSVSIAAIGPGGQQGPRSSPIIFRTLLKTDESSTTTAPPSDLSTIDIVDATSLKPSKPDRRFIFPTSAPRISTTTGNFWKFSPASTVSLSEPEELRKYTEVTTSETLGRLEITQPAIPADHRVQGIIDWLKISDKCALLMNEQMKIDLLIIGDSQSIEGSSLQQLYSMVLQNLVHTLNDEKLVSFRK